MQSLIVGANYPAPSLSGTLNRTISHLQNCWVNINLEVMPDKLVHKYSIEEIMPEDIIPFNISHNGIWNKEKHFIGWDFSDDQYRKLSYNISAEKGDYLLHGTGKFNEYYTSISGDNQLFIQCKVGSDRVSMPIFYPPPETSVPQIITITCATPGSEIRYTTDGTEPDLSDSLYSQMIFLTTNTVLRARAFYMDMTPSVIATANYPEEAITDEDISLMHMNLIENNTCQPAVQFSITPAETVHSYLAEIPIPIGITAFNMNEEGVWDSQLNTIKWGPFLDNHPRHFFFQVSGKQISFSLSGEMSFDGKKIECKDDAVIVITCDFFPQKDQCDPPVFEPSHGTVPISVSISCPTSDAQIRYTTDGSIPDHQSMLYTSPIQLNSQSTLRAKAFKQDLLSSDSRTSSYSLPDYKQHAKRIISNPISCSPGIQIEIIPDKNVFSYNVEEDLPEGLVPSDILPDGMWDESQRIIKWGPFLDGHERIFSYLLTSEFGDFAYQLKGNASFNGLPVEISGDENITIKCIQPPDQITAIAGNKTIYLSWNLVEDALGYNIYYGTSPFKYDHKIEINQGHDYYPIENLLNDMTYYFAITSYGISKRESDYSKYTHCQPQESAGSLGIIHFDQSYYPIKPHTAVITLKDNDLNKQKDVAESIPIRLISDTDQTGILLDLMESDKNSGIFTTILADTHAGFTHTASSISEQLLEVSNGDMVYASYNDSLPEMFITATAMIDTLPPQTSIVFDGYVRNEDNAYVSEGLSLTLSAIDHESGLDQIYYQINNRQILQYTQPISFFEQGEYTITYFSIDIADNKEIEKTITLTICPIAHMPIFYAHEEIHVDEDNLIDISVDPPISGDPDGTEILSNLVITGIFDTATLSAGNKQPNGSWEVPLNKLTDLYIKTEPHQSGSMLLNFQLVVTETESNDRLTLNKNVSIIIHPLADPPEILVNSVIQSKEDTEMPLHIQVNLVDKDYSEFLLPVIISGLPSHASLSHGNKQEDGAWNVDSYFLDELTLTFSKNYHGNIPLSIKAESKEIENGHTAKTIKDILLKILPVNDAPSITTISDQYILKNTRHHLIPFHILDDNTHSKYLKLNVLSSNDFIIPETSQHIIIYGKGKKRYIAITPLWGRYGESDITLQITDSENLSTTVSFKVSVTYTLAGDIDKNGIVNLLDTITVLNILTDISDNTIHIFEDVNKDYKTGLEDLIYMIKVNSNK